MESRYWKLLHLMVFFNNMESVPDLQLNLHLMVLLKLMNLAALQGASDKSTITVGGTGAALDIAYTDDGVAATAASSVLETVAIVNQSLQIQLMIFNSTLLEQLQRNLR